MQRSLLLHVLREDNQIQKYVYLKSGRRQWIFYKLFLVVFHYSDPSILARSLGSSTDNQAPSYSVFAYVALKITRIVNLPLPV